MTRLLERSLKRRRNYRLLFLDRDSKTNRAVVWANTRLPPGRPAFRDDRGGSRRSDRGVDQGQRLHQAPPLWVPRSHGENEDAPRCGSQVDKPSTGFINILRFKKLGCGTIPLCLHEPAIP